MNKKIGWTLIALLALLALVLLVVDSCLFLIPFNGGVPRG